MTFRPILYYSNHNCRILDSISRASFRREEVRSTGNDDSERINTSDVPSGNPLKTIASPSFFFRFAGPLSALKRVRRSDTPPKKSAAEDELNRVIQEQGSLLELLKKDKTGLEESLASLQNERNRAVKENTILRKAVSYQQEREKNLENAAKTIKATADERIKALENMILTLRYHLQAQNTTIGNDFMSQRPPDVY
jgi:hypothetical protein